LAGFASILLRMGNTAVPKGLIVDELRVGTTWASVTPPADHVWSGATNTEEDLHIEHTKQQDLVWFYSTIFGIPALVLAAGLFVRRRALAGGGK
jgi:hypothetical protein